MLELYQNIKARRIELGLSQSQLAEMTGYADKTAISHIENGKRDISHSKLIAFAVALKTTHGELLGTNTARIWHGNVSISGSLRS